MKIAVTYENGQVFQHFGHTEHFKLYDVENGAGGLRPGGGHQRQRPRGAGGLFAGARGGTR